MYRFPGLLKNATAVSFRRLAPATLLAPALLCGAMGYTQSTTSARLSGSVTDPSGAAIPHIKVTAKNIGTDLAVTVESDAAGNYAFNSLPVGQYQVTAAGTGFSSLVETGITLGVSQSITLNLPLKLGGSSDSVTVTGDADLINTTTANLHRQSMKPPSRTFRSTGATPEPWSFSLLALPMN
jgi:hypothetical protein